MKMKVELNGQLFPFNHNLPFNLTIPPDSTMIYASPRILIKVIFRKILCWKCGSVYLIYYDGEKT